MCTLALFRSVSSRYPLIVAANRDEFLVRPTGPPETLAAGDVMIAGRDLDAGGTWLGWRNRPQVLVAGVLNRRRNGSPAVSSGMRSRGLLPLHVLEQPTIERALKCCLTERLDDYGPFSLLLADLRRAVVVSNASARQVTELPEGVTVLTNAALNDPACPRLASARVDFEALVPLIENDPPPETVVSALTAVVGNHDNTVDPDNRSPLARLCVHMEGYGTRSSTVLLAEAGGGVLAYHADGPPCRTPLTRL